MTRFDPASFKDPAGRVFYHGGWVCRTLSEEARQNFQHAQRSGLIDALVRDQLLLDTELVRAADLGPTGPEVGGVVLKQPRVVPVTYAYEWSFEMLRDGALATLQALDRALASGFVLKDANSFNVLFDRNRPTLVDVLSIEPYKEGTVWAGYAQFCRSFLFPLLVGAYRDIDVQAILAGTMGELPLQLTARLLRPLDRFRPGVLKDVVLQARLERTFARAARSVGQATAEHPYPKAALVASVRRLLKIIADLKAPSTPSEWSGYDTFHTYAEADLSAKAAFVERALGGRRDSQVVDLGCNTGEYSQVAIKAGARVVAVDLDARAIDRMYRGLPRGVAASLLVANLLKPTPAMGWELEERRPLLERLRSDVFLALALVHHLRITGGVPLDRIVRQLFAIAPEGIVEWVDREDAMVRHMLSLRPDVYTDYSWESFERLLERHGRLLSVECLQGGRRRLCHVRAA